MKKFLFKVNPIIYAIAVVLLFLRLFLSFTFGVCVGCEEDGLRQVINDVINTGGSIGFLLLLAAIVISIFKRQDKKR